ncbi:MAG: LemA family protein [Leptolyngbyaceae cyanobacterium bins.59]|nr:LemA family protein [Leptolyngbyaceae cyanobacterium bins.59]
MKTFLSFLLALAIIGGILFAIWMTLYNSLIDKKNQVEKAFSSIDVLLKKRSDLIPNLVATVQKYMQFEQETLTEIARLRSKAIQAKGNERVQLENQISHSLGNIMIAVEAYPELKANQNFADLQASLNETEEQISAARRFYNSAVTDLNNAIEMFPTNLLASSMNLRPKPFFEATEQERQNVDVGNLFNRP